MAEPTIISLDRSPSPPPYRSYSAHKELCNRLGRAKSDPALQSLCDVDLRVGDTTFKAHRIILASSSPVLARMFTNGMRETKQREVVLKELDANCFEIALEFLYSGEIELCCMDSAISLYAVAQRFQFDALQKLLDTFIGQKLTIQNTCTVIDLAETRNFPELKKVAMKKLEREFVRICQINTFTQLSFEAIEELFRSSTVMLQGEVQVFRAIAYWLDPSTKERLFQDNIAADSQHHIHENDEVENASIILQLDSDVLIDGEEGPIADVEMTTGTAESQRRCVHPSCLTHRMRNSGDGSGGISAYTMARIGGYIPQDDHSEYANKLLSLVRLDLMEEEDLKEIARFEWCKKYPQFYSRILNIILKKKAGHARSVEARKMKSRSELKESKKRVRFIDSGYSDYTRGRHRRSRLQRNSFRNLDE